MASQRLKQTMRAVLATGAIVAAVSTIPATTATADTPTDNATANYNNLAQQADQLNEQLNNAQVQLAAKEAQLGQATAGLAAAKAALAQAQGLEDQFRGSVDALTAASFEGARVSQLSALLTGSSTEDYLNRATDLQDLADSNDQILAQYQAAVDKATKAAAAATADQNAAQAATTAAQNLVNSIQQQKTAVEAKVAAAQAALDKLSSSERASLTTGTDNNGHFIAPAGVAGEAMNEALTQIGKPYQWAGAGPNSYDCSGLVMWSYAHFGVNLPHSAAGQASYGVAVPISDIQAGDLVFFDSPIGHVGIAVSHTEMVDAPQTGQDVQVQSIWSGVTAVRRLGS